MIFGSINSNNYTMKTKFNGILTLLLALSVQFVFAQKTVSGTVSDEAGPLPGVNVLIKGTTTGTETNFDGNYSLMASEGQTLVFSYVGYNNVEKVVGTANVYDVMMTGGTILDEVVITAVGIERKPKELSYSVSTVKDDDLTKTRSTNVATAMVGKVSGLQINTINNSVNPNTRVILRGNRSLLGNNEALIVIDGYPASRSALDRINPDDISNVTILKGANASGLYGSEAANGVVVITTKKGKGDFSVNFSSTLQLERVAYLPELQDEFGSGGFPDGTLYPLENVNWGPRYDGRLVDVSETLNDGSVWQVPFTPIKRRNEKFFDTGMTLRNGIQMSAGDEKNSYLFSVDHSIVGGVIPKDKYNRTNLRFNASKRINKFSIGTNFNFFRSNLDVVGNDVGRQQRPIYWNVINTPLHVPLEQMKNWRDGKFTRNEVSYFRFYENPYFIIDTQRFYSKFNDFTFITDLNYDFTDWLKGTFKVGYTGTSGESKKEYGAYKHDFYLDHTYSDMDDYGAKTADQLTKGSRLNTDLLFTIDKELNENFGTKLILGHNLRTIDYREVNTNGDNLILPGFYNISTRTGELGGSEYLSQERKVGVYGDLTLSYKNFLYLNFTGRNDWTSTFAKENRSFFYPGGGISLIISNAIPSLVSDNGLSYLKTSLNITKTGNNTSPYAANSTFFAPTGFPFGTTPGLSQSSRIVANDLGPEFTTSIEAGLEYAFLKNRISGNITAYKTNTTDQLVPINVSTAASARSYLTNLGEVENLGLEFDLNVDIIRNENVNWKVGGNYSGYKSEVISLKDGVDELDIGGFTDNSVYVVAKVGEPYPLLRTTSYLRDDQGRVIVDGDGDPIQSSVNQIQGKTTPDYILGFNTQFSYKNFKFYAVADYRTGHVFYNSLVDALEFTGLTAHSVTAGRQPFVFPNSSYSDGNGGFVENTNRLTSGGGNAFWDSYNEVKENYVTDATTWKIREASLSYTFDDDILKNNYIKSIDVGLFGRNLFTFRPAANVYTDPEFNYTSGNAVGIGTQAQTPPTRQFGLKLNVKF